MQYWEYQVVKAPRQWWSTEESMHTLQNFLNMLGAQGWEVVEMGSSEYIVLKRAI